MKTPKRISGTLEWASHNENCLVGCPHDCAYCYARANAVDRFKTIPKGEWTNVKVNEKKMKKRFGKKEGTIMFPTAHDIVPEYIDECIEFLRKMLTAGNNVLVVSKPHLECIEKICDELDEFRHQVLFRFTIGAMDNDILEYWEPGAPIFEERLESLVHAHCEGWKTSVSCEPMLDGNNMVELFHKLEPFVTDSIWIGKMNHVEKRVKIENDEDREMADRIVAGQTDERVHEIYEALKDEPKVKWKESFKEVLGLETPEEPGMDI